ncbi:MAG: rhodanese-like domain-containing protein [Phycisphaerae bacterium]|nr:rhodanese-like domain-containing protein [Phycisphaerae bacterium]MBN8597650.1 rhodanese-like domain-containing protein [Planctomycetota bacterium]
MLRSNSLRVPSAIVGLLGAVLCAMVFAGCEKDTRDSDIVNVKVAEVSELVKDAEGNPTALLLIDPRPQTEFEEGHIPGARNLLLTRFDGEKGRDPRIQAFSEAIVYGQDPSSPVARAVVKRMLAMEYKDIRFFAGGLNEWKAANLPIETGPSKPLPAAKAATSRGRGR